MKLKAYCTKCGSDRNLTKRPEEYVNGCHCKRCKGEIVLVPADVPDYLKGK